MVAPLAPKPDLPALIAVWQSAAEDFVALVDSLDDAEWATRTDLPGWTVGDVVGHVAWLEASILGEADPPHEPDWSALPHVTSDFGRFTEVPVDLRRSWTREAVVVQLIDVVARRSEQLATGEADPDEQVVAAFGSIALVQLMGMRSLDIWVHEQDIRRAIGRPGGLGTPGAQWTARQLISALPMVWGKRAGATAGQVLHVAIAEPGIADAITIAVGDDGRARMVADDLIDQAGPATVSVSLPWEAFALLGCGRAAAADFAEQVQVSGDAELGDRLLAGLSITP